MEGENINLEVRYAAGNPDRLSEFATALIRLPVDLIVTAGPTATNAAKKVTNTVAIVMAQDTDALGAGFVDILAHPGRNITGLSRLAPELSGKQLEILKEAVPRLSRVMVLETSTQPGTTQQLKQVEATSKALALQSHYFDILAPNDIVTAFKSKEHFDGVLLLSGPILFVEREKIIQLATKNRLPAMYSAEEFVEHGGLMSYAANVTDLWRRAAAYVDKILKGAKHGPPRRATDKVRVGDQLENRQADRPDNSGECAGESG